MDQLTQLDLQRYAKHLILPSIGVYGQTRIKNSKILFIGAGGLSSSGLLYVVTAGIGTVGIIDSDFIELSNLHRQILYNPDDIGYSKVMQAQRHLSRLNPDCKFHVYNTKLNRKNALSIIKNYDIVIDGTDNLPIRYIIANACYLVHKIHIYGAVSNFEGQISVFNYRSGPIYSELYARMRNLSINSCSFGGILNVLTGCIAILQVNEALKIITGTGLILTNYLMNVNLLTLVCRKTRIRHQSNSQHYNVSCKTNQCIVSNISISIICLSNIFKCNNLYIIDIRDTTEYNISHFKRSINIPLFKFYLLENIYGLYSLSNQFKIVLYCSSQIRIHIASRILFHFAIPHMQFLDYI